MGGEGVETILQVAYKARKNRNENLFRMGVTRSMNSASATSQNRVRTGVQSIDRFARNGGVDAKDFQRMWREREMLGSGRVGAGSSNKARLPRPASEIWTEGEGRGRGTNGSSAGIGPEKTFKVSPDMT